MSQLTVINEDDQVTMVITNPPKVNVVIARGSGPQGPQGASAGTEEIDAAVLDHVNSLTPHPVYDEGPSLFLLYENAKV